MRNLVIVAHPDDEILGFGATGSKLATAGEKVQALILCGNVDARTQRPSDKDLYEDIQAANQLAGFMPPILGQFPNIKLNTVPHLDLVQFIEAQVACFRPTRIFTHHPGDLNDDHLQVARAASAATRLFQRRSDVVPPRSLHTIEIPSSTDWLFSGVHPVFSPNCYEEIGDFLEIKLKALACYRSVMRPFPHSRSAECITGLAAYRGGQAGLKYAEAFCTLFQRGL
jgi:LmbE family N-acetylglucosaminyl deacetylase